jgi:hypothetical protein
MKTFFESKNQKQDRGNYKIVTGNFFMDSPLRGDTFKVQRPMLNAQRPTPNAQRLTPNAQRTTLGANFIFSNCHLHPARAGQF